MIWMLLAVLASVSVWALIVMAGRDAEQWDVHVQAELERRAALKRIHDRKGDL